MWPKENSPKRQSKIRFNDKCKKEKSHYDAHQIETDLMKFQSIYWKASTILKKCKASIFSWEEQELENRMQLLSLKTKSQFAIYK